MHQQRKKEYDIFRAAYNSNISFAELAAGVKVRVSATNCKSLQNY